MTLLRIASPLLLAALALCAGTAHAGTVGHYEMCSGTGSADHAAMITAAGHTPVNVETPNGATLATLDSLFVTNCSNGDFGAEYVANLPAIATAVSNGLVLIVHDRFVTGAGSVLPGGSGIVATRSFDDDANVDIPAGSPITTGIGGTLTNTSLDGGSSSNHGYVAAASLPAGSQVLATRAAASDAVTVAYPFGAGRVVYSTIPLDAYFGSDGDGWAFADNLIRVYGPNVIGWAVGPSFTTCAAEGYTGTKLTLCRKVCESNLTGTTLTAMIRLYVAAYREQPACVR
jgi:large repetitive protein